MSVITMQSFKSVAKIVEEADITNLLSYNNQKLKNSKFEKAITL